MMKLIITGANGFVGKNLVPYLEESNFECLEISRKPNPSINKKVISYEALPELLMSETSISGIIHLAGKAHDLKKTQNSEEYYKVNTELTQKIFDLFLISNASVFIYISSVKAVVDYIETPLHEGIAPSPKTDYGKSKLEAERYIQQSEIPPGKKIYILRPCIIHGPGNKGNLALLYKIVKMGFPYPFGRFQNQRSFLTIENLCFVIREFLLRKDIDSGIYHVADEYPLSTQKVIEIMGNSISRSPVILNINPGIIKMMARVGDLLQLPFNSESLNKLTQNYVVDNQKLIKALQCKLPVEAEFGFKSSIPYL